MISHSDWQCVEVPRLKLPAVLRHALTSSTDTLQQQGQKRALGGGAY